MSALLIRLRGLLSRGQQQASRWALPVACLPKSVSGEQHAGAVATEALQRSKALPGALASMQLMVNCAGSYSTGATVQSAQPQIVQKSATDSAGVEAAKPPLQGASLARIGTTIKVMTRGRRVAGKLDKLAKNPDARLREELMLSCAGSFLTEIKLLLDALPDENTLDCIGLASMVHRIGVVAHYMHSKDWIFEEHSKLLTSLLDKFDRKFNEAQPHHMANVLWGMAQLGRRSLNLPLQGGTARRLLDRIVETVPNRCGSLKGNSVCHHVVGLALLYDEVPPGSLDPLLRRASEQLSDEETKPMNLAHLLWGLATLGYDDGTGTVEAAVKRLAFMFQRLGDCHVSDVVWALGKLKSPHSSEFIMKVQARAEGNGFGFHKARMSPEHVIRLAWGLAQLNYKTAAEGMIKALCRELMHRRAEYSDLQVQEFVDICGGMGTDVQRLIEV